MQIREATYFDKIKEEDSKYLTKNIELMTEKLIKEYDKNIRIPDKIESIIKETLKDKDKVIEGRNKNKSLKNKIEDVKDRSDKMNKDLSPEINRDIERN